jgi:hypothetical protein
MRGDSTGQRVEWDGLADLSSVDRLKSLGFQWLAMDSDLSLVREGFRSNLDRARP